MSMPLWMSIEPMARETRLQLSAPMARSCLRARLPATPQHPRALLTLLESMSLWYGTSLHAVVDADAEDIRRDPEKWAVLLGDAPELSVRVHYVSVPVGRRNRRDRFLSELGDFGRAERMTSFAATGLLR
jgi:hypothetical protein